MENHHENPMEIPWEIPDVCCFDPRWLDGQAMTEPVGSMVQAPATMPSGATPAKRKTLRRAGHGETGSFQQKNMKFSGNWIGALNGMDR